MIHCRNAEQFAIAKDAWSKLVQGNIKVGRKVQLLSEYFEVNWLACEELWATHHRRQLDLLFTNTTNRIESLFGKLKSEMKACLPSTPSIANFIPFRNISWWE